MTFICGIDEAGRGPVIGPLVIAGFCIDKANEYILREMGVKDSKLLSAKERERLFDGVKKIAKSYKIFIVEPNEIDRAVTGEDGGNLNWLEGKKAVEIINELAPDEAIVDCPSTNILQFTGFLEKQLTKKTILVVEHKADTNHLAVGAASILAKVTRDREIQKLEEKYGRMGSGYPADPITQAFIKENYNKYPEIFRKSWETFKTLVKNGQQKKLEF